MTVEAVCVLTDPPQHYDAPTERVMGRLWLRLPADARLGIGTPLVQVATGGRWLAEQLHDPRRPDGALVVVARQARAA